MLSSVFRTNTIILLISILVLNAAVGFTDPSRDQTQQDLQQVYLPLVLNQQLLDEVRVLIDPASMEPHLIHVEAFELLRSAIRQPVIEAILSSSAQRNGDSFVSLETAADEGIEIVLDQQDSVLIARAQPGAAISQKLSVQQRNHRIPDTLQSGSRVSIFANVDGTVEYRYAANDVADPHYLPATITADTGITLASDSNSRNHNLYGKITHAHHLDPAINLDEARYRLDLPDRMITMQAGTTALPQYSVINEQNIIGAVLTHNGSLQPLRITRSLGRSTIYLESPSRVRILVNGRTVDQLNLPAGEFDIQDIPLPAGRNSIRLEITDDMQRTETIRISTPHNPGIQLPGSTQYALGAGVMEKTPEHWKTAGFIQHGLHEKWTAGFGAAAAPGEALAALSSINASQLGNFTLDLAGYMEFTDDTIAYDGMVQMEYQLLFPEHTAYPRVAAGSRVQGPRVRTPSDRPNTGNRDAVSLYTTIAQSLSRNLGISATLRGNLRREPSESSAQIVLTLGNYLERGANLLVRGSVELFETMEPRTQLSISYSFTPGRSSRRPAASITHNLTEPGTSISLSSTVHQQAGTLLSASGAIQNITLQDPEADAYTPASGSAALRLTTPVFESSLRGSHDFDQRDSAGRSSLSARAAAGVVYADGAASFSRPNRDAFVILVPHPLYEDFDVGLQTNRGDAAARLYPWGSGSIVNLKSYAYHTLLAEAAALPDGYSLDVDRYHINPGYQQGTKIVIGSDANVSAVLQLQTADDEPLPLAAGWVYDEQDDRERFFSNRDGTVELYGLRHGSYRLQLLDGRSGLFEVPADVAGRIQLGAVKME